MVVGFDVDDDDEGSFDWVDMINGIFKIFKLGTQHTRRAWNRTPKSNLLFELPPNLSH